MHEKHIDQLSLSLPQTRWSQCKTGRTENDHWQDSTWKAMKCIDVKNTKHKATQERSVPETTVGYSTFIVDKYSPWVPM